jgi:hypothetical protein
MENKYFTVHRRLSDENQQFGVDGLLITEGVLTGWIGSDKQDDLSRAARDFFDRLYNQANPPKHVYLYDTGIAFATAIILRAWYHWAIKTNNTHYGMSTMHYHMRETTWVELIHF